MKTTISILIFMVVGFICFTPRMPAPYPPESVLKQKESITFKEVKLDRLINKIEYEIHKDTIELKMLKK